MTVVVSTASASTRNGVSASSGEREVRTVSNSSTTAESDLIEPIHPGEILMEDFIEGFGITQNKLAVSIGIPPRRINEIVHGKRGITADTAIRLARYFGTSEEFWMNLQSNYELRMERRALRDTVASITPLRGA
ncbi:HigA family addiction module antitoxin [Acidipropionibacterium jensenii]|uniref:HigA family addiction module antitoxin n=1 Tax=Acidipropionibacterium jensenii TaxID=1749 RepID=UPI003F51257E